MSQSLADNVSLVELSEQISWSITMENKMFQQVTIKVAKIKFIENIL